MKRLLFVVALATTSFYSLAAFYDNVPTTPPEQTPEHFVWDYGNNPAHQFVVMCDVMGCSPSATQSGKQDLNGKFDSLDAGTYCQEDFSNHSGHALQNTDGSTKTVELTGTVPDGEQYKLTISCAAVYEENGTQIIKSISWTHDWPFFEYMGSVCPLGTTEINNNCYDDFLLQDADSCDTQTPYLPADGSAHNSVCWALDDGSMCRMSRSDASQTYFTPDLENSMCLTGDTPIYTDTPFAPNGDSCQDIGNGVTACPENPNNVCPNGVCQTGCGNVSFDGVEQFICFDSDTDGDGVGDYADPDIDGDGIPNEDDPDADGDGNPDPEPDPVDPPVDGENPTIDPTALADAIADRLIEQGDLSADGSEANADAKNAAYESSIDTLVNSDNLKFSNTITESGIDNTFDTAKNILAPSGCAANIAIPFTAESLDICDAATKAKPFLYVLFALGTFIYIYRRVLSTARSES